MECFQVRYDSRVVIYERKLFIRLATGQLKNLRTILIPVRVSLKYNWLKIF